MLISLESVALKAAMVICTKTQSFLEVQRQCGLSRETNDILEAGDLDELLKESLTPELMEKA